MDMALDCRYKDFKVNGPPPLDMRLSSDHLRHKAMRLGERHCVSEVQYANVQHCFKVTADVLFVVRF